jgi:hypothetical protein
METALERILTSSYKAAMISYMASHPEDFMEAIELALSDKQPYSWRAAWLLWSCMEKNDHRVQEHMKDLIDAIPTKNDNQQRELFLILQNMELNEEVEGILFNICVNVWEKVNKKPSVRLNAFRLVVKIAKKYPELSNEIGFLTQNQYMNSLSPAARKSIFRMIKNIVNTDPNSHLNS